MAATVSNVQLTTTSTQKESAAKFTPSAKSSTKTLEFANNAIKDTPSATAPAPSSPPELKSTPDAKPGTAMEIASSAQSDSSPTPMEYAHQFPITAETGTNKLEIAQLATLAT